MPSEASSPTLSPIVATRPDCVVVENLCVPAFIGVHDFERLERQRVRFDVEVDTVDGYADIVRATGEYVSYADIVEYVQQRAATDEHVELVETWADDIASFVLGNDLAAAVRVRVTKPDIFDGADGVGVSIERRRPERGEPARRFASGGRGPALPAPRPAGARAAARRFRDLDQLWSGSTELTRPTNDLRDERR